MHLQLESLEDRITPSFSSPTSFPLEFAPAAVLSADFNHDDRLDLATLYPAGSVFLGDGQGGFGAPSPFGVADSSLTLVDADFNNDGHLDLATLNDDRSVSVIRGNGDGTFQPPVKTELAPKFMVHSLAAADFNGDGNIDLVYSADEGDWMTHWGSVEVLLGDGQGGFAARHQHQLHTKNSYGLTVADLNADSLPDVVTTSYDVGSYYDYRDGAVSVLLGNGDGTLSYDVNSSIFKTAARPTDVVVGDFTSDGIPDLATNSVYVGGVAVLPGRGDGTFVTPNFFSWADDIGGSLVAADFNGDDRLDVLTVNIAGWADEWSWYPTTLFLGRGDGTFAAEAVEIGTWWATGSADAGDFNGDGRPDLAVGVTDYVMNAAAVMLNDGDWAPLLPTLTILRDSRDLPGGEHRHSSRHVHRHPVGRHRRDGHRRLRDRRP